jgi:hypothetical protein
MKRCPKCGTAYADETLNFCLEDGQWLVAEDEPATAILNTSGSASEAATRAQLRTTAEAQPADKTATPMSSVSLPRAAKPLVIALAAALVVLGGFFAYRYLGSVGTPQGQINSIAVLPFENRSGNAETDDLSDG